MSSSQSAAFQLKRRTEHQHQTQHQPLPLLPVSAQQLQSQHQLILQQRNVTRQRHCSQILETVLETLSTPRLPKTSARSSFACSDESSDRNDRNDHDDSENNAMMTTTRSSPALASYFHMLTMEREMFDIDECNVVVDNARIPLEHGVQDVEDDREQDLDALFHERMSRSLSDIPTVSLSPEFLQDEEDQKHASASCRWESFNSSSSSCDISLSIPRRTWDTDDLEGDVPPLTSSHRLPQAQPTPPTPPLPGKRRNLAHAFSLDSTARFLRQLPLDTASSHTSSTHSSGSRTSCRTCSFHERSNVDEDQELPLLSSFDRFAVQHEPHPKAALRRLSSESLDLLDSFRDDDAGTEATDEETKEDFEDDDDSTLVESEDEQDGSTRRNSVTLPLESVSCDRWDIQSPPKSRSQDFISLGKANETPKDWSVNSLKLLTHHVSPRTLADFPIAPSFSSSPYKFSEKRNDEYMREIFESSGQFLELHSSP